MDAGFDFNSLPANQIVSSALQHSMLVWLFVDFILSRNFVMLTHGLYFVFLFIAYLFTNVMYTVLARPIYSGITWTEAKSYYVAIIGFVVLQLALVAVWIATHVRDAIYRRCCCCREPDVHATMQIQQTEDAANHSAINGRIANDSRASSTRSYGYHPTVANISLPESGLTAGNGYGGQMVTVVSAPKQPHHQQSLTQTVTGRPTVTVRPLPAAPVTPSIVSSTVGAVAPASGSTSSRTVTPRTAPRETAHSSAVSPTTPTGHFAPSTGDASVVETVHYAAPSVSAAPANTPVVAPQAASVSASSPRFSPADAGASVASGSASYAGVSTAHHGGSASGVEASTVETPPLTGRSTSAPANDVLAGTTMSLLAALGSTRAVERTSSPFHATEIEDPKKVRTTSYRME